MIDETTTENAATEDNDAAFFDSVIADIDKSAAEPSSDDLDLQDDESIDDSKSDKTSASDAPSQDKRKNQNRAQERIQQVIAQRDLTESKYQSTIERLNVANEKVALLESQIASYEPIIREFTEFKASFSDTSDTDTKAPASDKPLTSAELDRLLEERETKRKNFDAETEKVKSVAEENQKILKAWEPHLKIIQDDKCPADKKAAFTKFCAGSGSTPSGRELIKVLGKYTNATDIIFGISKKQGFDAMSLSEQVEFIVKLDNKLSQHKQKNSNATSTDVTSKKATSADAPSSYEEYIRKRYGK